MKRTKQSQKKTKFLLILIVLTAILSITATYAWFSSQREVDITGIKLNVEVAESMQISLDGERWVQSIQLSNMRQFYGTYSVTTTHQAKKTDNANYVPTELKPVSTIGEVSAGRLQFMAGESQMGTDGTTSLSAVSCSETDLVMGQPDIGALQTANGSHPYLVFDMYLRNYSRSTEDNLQLNAGSKVWVNSTDAASQEGTGVEGTGLENCARVAFVVYENTADTTAAAEDIRDLASTEANAKVAIWEPNDLEHIPEVVANSKRGVEDGVTMPTFGVKFASGKTADSPLAIADIEADEESDTLKQQYTMKPAYTTAGVTTATNITTAAASPADIKIAGNKITKVRVYVWIEGQDVDCINAASYGDRLQATIKLTKPVNNTQSPNTYEGDPVT